MLMIARLVRLVFSVIVAVIVIAIAMRLLNANPGNQVVRDVHNAANDFVGPFRNLFTIHNPKLAITVNWGIAAILISMIGELLTRLCVAVSPSGRRVTSY